MIDDEPTQIEDPIQVPDVLKPLINVGFAFGHMGGTSDNRTSLGHVKLTYAAKVLFGIERYPTHAERFTTDWSTPRHFEDVGQAMEKTSENEWSAIVRALEAVHKRTVAALLEHYPSGRIVLQRRLTPRKSYAAAALDIVPSSHHSLPDYTNTYAGQLCLAILKARAEGKSEIHFETDIVTGWCRDDPGSYGEILLRKEFDIRDIIMAAPYTLRPGPLERDEWLVINRSPSGLMTLSVDAVEIPPEAISYFHPYVHSTSWKDLAHWRYSNAQERVERPYPLPPSHGQRYCFEPPWFVHFAHRLHRYLIMREARIKERNARPEAGPPGQ